VFLQELNASPERLAWVELGANPDLHHAWRSGVADPELRKLLERHARARGWRKDMVPPTGT
jgi:hypothetical protein